MYRTEAENLNIPLGDNWEELVDRLEGEDRYSGDWPELGGASSPSSWRGRDAWLPLTAYLSYLIAATLGVGISLFLVAGDPWASSRGDLWRLIQELGRMVTQALFG